MVSLPPPPGLGECEALFEVPLGLVAKAGDVQARRATIPFERFARLPLVIATMPNGGRVLVEEEARNAGIALNVVVELNSIHVMKKLVARGGLYSLASPSAVADRGRGEGTRTVAHRVAGDPADVLPRRRRAAPRERRRAGRRGTPARPCRCARQWAPRCVSATGGGP